MSRFSPSLPKCDIDHLFFEQMNRIKVVMLGASLEQNGGIATVEKLILKYAPVNTELQHITSHDEGSIAHRIIVFGQALLLLLQTLLLQKVDVVHIHISDGASLIRKAILALIALLFRKPVIMHTHGAEFQVTYARLPQWVQQGLKRIFQQCNFIVLSQTWKEYYQLNLGLHHKPVIILPNPTEIPTQIPNRTNVTQVRLGFFGRVGERKGTFDLIQAFANLPQHLKDNSALVIAGDGEIAQGQDLVKNLHLTNYVTFRGWINASTRDALLATIDVFVLPSYNEGLPMALLEAMGWGLPVIVTPVGGIPELVTTNSNGLLVTPGDIQQLSAAMELLITNEAVRLSLGKAARATVKAFDVKDYCQELGNIYSSVLAPADSVLSPKTAS